MGLSAQLNASFEKTSIFASSPCSPFSSFSFLQQPLPGAQLQEESETTRPTAQMLLILRLALRHASATTLRTTRPTCTTPSASSTSASVSSTHAPMDASPAPPSVAQRVLATPSPVTTIATPTPTQAAPSNLSTIK